MLCATIANHAAAGFIGVHLGRFLTPALLDGVVGASMIGMALRTLKPDALDEESAGPRRSSAFVATTIAFFFAEILLGAVFVFRAAGYLP